MRRLSVLSSCALTVLSLLFVSHATFAQELSDEMRDIFEEMIPELDADLQAKLRQALDRQHDFIELTPDQFKRFRDHPANPFEGWNGIDPDKIDGLIRLQFETQPIRSRTPGPWERQAENQLSKFSSVIGPAAASTVRITNGKKQIALGTVVSADGYIVTKLSEINSHSKLFCKSSDKQTYSAEVIGKNAANDIALLKIGVDRIPFANLDNDQPGVGAFVLSTGGQNSPLAMGVYSNPPRSLVGKNQAFLGVKPVKHDLGLEVIEVTAGSAAEKAGLKVGDIITAINGKKLNSVDGLVNVIRSNAPGDKIHVDFLRNRKPQDLIATLAGRNVAGPIADRFKMMETFGAIPSKRRDEFPLVFQHDTPLLPEQCGGPVTDLQGRIVGINIARGGRVASYAIPAKHVKTLVAEMMRPSVARKEKELD